MGKFSFAHIINPVKVSEKSDLFVAQPITFKSIKNAVDFTQLLDPTIQVDCLTCQFDEDVEIIPEFFHQTKNLDHCIQDDPRFSNEKKLPYLHEIFERVLSSSEADYIIYSNVDIGLYPNFYLSIKREIEKGYDAICVNRNTLVPLDNNFQLEDIYSLRGMPHEGIDCFVIKRDIVERLILKGSIIGTGPVGLVIAVNLLALSNKYKWITEGNFTFHIGDDKSWLSKEVSKESLLYYSFEELNNITRELLEISQDELKSKVIESCSIHAQYFLKYLKFLPDSVHRRMLLDYSDGRYDDITEEKVFQLKKLLEVGESNNFQDNSSKGSFIGKIKRRLNK